MKRRYGNRGTRNGWRRAPRPPRTGLTLIELMIVLAILAIMVLAVSTMLASARQTVKNSQTLIKANAQARAVAAVLRADIQALCKDGFLAITWRRATFSMEKRAHQTGKEVTVTLPHLIFTSVGSFRSKLDPYLVGSAARVEYGLGYDVDDLDTDNWGDDYVRELMLYRRAILQAAGSSESEYDGWSVYDKDRWFMAQYNQNLPEAREKVIAKRIFRGWTVTNQREPAILDAPDITLPILCHYDYVFVSASGRSFANHPWAYVIGNVTDMNIEWTDGSRESDGSGLRWFGGYDPDTGEWAARDASWRAKNAAYQDENLNEDAPEFAGSYSGAWRNYDADRKGLGYYSQEDMYCAMWTTRKRDKWPRAIKITLTIGEDPSRTYEIIIDIPR